MPFQQPTCNLLWTVVGKAVARRDVFIRGWISRGDESLLCLLMWSQCQYGLKSFFFPFLMCI